MPKNWSQKANAKAEPIVLTTIEKEFLQERVLQPNSKATIAKAILLAADGLTHTAIAKETNLTRQTVAKWRRRYQLTRSACLLPAPRKLPSNIATCKAELMALITKAASETSNEKLSRVFNVSKETIRRTKIKSSVCSKRSQIKRLTVDPNFAERMIDVIGILIEPKLERFLLVVWEPSAMGDYKPKGQLRGLKFLEGESSVSKIQMSVKAAVKLLTDSSLESQTSSAELGFIDFVGCVGKSMEMACKLHVLAHLPREDDKAKLVRFLENQTRFKYHPLNSIGTWLQQLAHWLSHSLHLSLRANETMSITPEIEVLKRLARTEIEIARFYWIVSKDSRCEKDIAIKTARTLDENPEPDDE